MHKKKEYTLQVVVKYMPFSTHNSKWAPYPELYAKHISALSDSFIAKG